MLAGQGFIHSRHRAVLSRTSPSHLVQRVRLAGLRPRVPVKVSAAVRSLSGVKDNFFNREEELAALDLRFAKNPRELLILLGPLNCGKSVSSSKAIRSFVADLILCLLSSPVVTTLLTHVLVETT